MSTQKTIMGPTPNGGVKNTAYFTDGKGNPVEKEKATRVKIVEYDAKGNSIYRTYMEK